MIPFRKYTLPILLLALAAALLLTSCGSSSAQNNDIPEDVFVPDPPEEISSEAETAEAISEGPEAAADNGADAPSGDSAPVPAAPDIASDNDVESVPHAEAAPDAEVLSDENISEEESSAPGGIAALKAASHTDQIITVTADGSSAVVSMYNKNADSTWTELLSTSAFIGKNGIGKTKEGDKKTPTGQYMFTMAFGIKEDPGTAFPYTQVNSSHYWVDDSSSSYYNRFVSTDQVTADWTSAEHLIKAGSSYHYALAVNYNSSCTPGAGSAIFRHCTPTGGAGCIAVPESSMKTILQNVRTNCILIIDTEENISSY